MSLNGLFLSFSALCDFYIYKENNFSQMFPIVVPRIFLGLRYGADLGRSRLVCICSNFSKKNKKIYWSVSREQHSTWCCCNPRCSLWGPCLCVPLPPDSAPRTRCATPSGPPTWKFLEPPWCKLTAKGQMQRSFWISPNSPLLVLEQVLHP